MRTRTGHGGALGLALACLAGGALAHPLAPSLLELRESGEGQVAMSWRTPRVRVAGSRLEPDAPSGCEVVGTPSRVVQEGAQVTRWSLDCPGGLTGRRVAVQGLAASATDVVVRLVRADGRESSLVLRGATSAFVVPAAPSGLAQLLSYAALGLSHIAGGFDHLLFILGLFLLVRRGSALVLTVTAFTAGHAVTLGLAVLGVVRVPAAPVEVAIAASLMLLALMLSRGERWRRAPLLFAGGFGLLHGLGFAGALSRAGLPEAQLPLAIFAFHLGIEAGQIAFLALCAAARALLRRWAPRVAAFGPRAPAYAIGSLAAFWLIQRVAALW
jgi:hypothetical protein